MDVERQRTTFVDQSGIPELGLESPSTRVVLVVSGDRGDSNSDGISQDRLDHRDVTSSPAMLGQGSTDLGSDDF